MSSYYCTISSCRNRQCPFHPETINHCEVYSIALIQEFLAVEPKPDTNLQQPTQEHSGNKYLRHINAVRKNTSGDYLVDVYCVLEAFQVHCPAVQHAVKKLLCAGLRGKGSRRQDLKEALDAITRACQLEVERQK